MYIESSMSHIEEVRNRDDTQPLNRRKLSEPTIS